jgi:hypothetical protein
VSLNYCDKNPVQGLMNTHCWHDVRSSRAHKDGTMTVYSVCCWCNDTQAHTEFVKHGPYPKARMPKKARQR